MHTIYATNSLGMERLPAKETTMKERNTSFGLH